MDDKSHVKGITTREELKAMTSAERRERFRDGLVDDQSQLPDWYAERIQQRMDEAAKRQAS